MEIRGSHPIFGQWASRYQARTNHRKVHARAEKFSTYYTHHICITAKLFNFYAFCRFSLLTSNKFDKVEFINWLVKKSRPFPTTSSPLAHPVDIRRISTSYPPNGFIIFGSGSWNYVSTYRGFFLPWFLFHFCIIFTPTVKKVPELCCRIKKIYIIRYASIYITDLFPHSLGHVTPSHPKHCYSSNYCCLSSKKRQAWMCGTNH